MAVYKHYLPSIGGAPTRYFYVADTEAELPSSGLEIGSLGFALDTKDIYAAVSATTWEKQVNVNTSITTTQLPASVVLDNEANTFSAKQTFQQSGPAGSRVAPLKIIQSATPDVLAEGDVWLDNSIDTVEYDFRWRGSLSTKTAISTKLNTTGAGVTALGTNCPAVTATAPYTWIETKALDGSTVYIPAWK